MKKVIVISSMGHLPAGAFEFAHMLNKQQPVLLVGVFLPETDYTDTLLYYSGGAVAPVLYYSPEDETVVTANEAITRFERFCVQNGIRYKIHEKQFKDIKHELATESRFADLLLFSNESFSRNLDTVIFHEYVSDILHGAECPVLVVPEKFQPPQNVILAYDGSLASVYAIRAFAEIFPNFTSMDTLLVNLDPDKNKPMPEKELIEALAKCHFSKLSFLKLDIAPQKHVTPWLAEQRKTILVTGAYGRSKISEWFNESFVSGILKTNRMPVFIAHP